MGHCKGVDAVGGEYDRSPEVHEEVFEVEYAKLEPYVNIYSGKTRRIGDPMLARIEHIMEEDQGRKFFASFLKWVEREEPVSVKKEWKNEKFDAR